MLFRSGGVFDHLLIFRDSGWPREIILAGSSVLKAHDYARSRRPALYWRDSYPRWNMALAKVGKAIGLPKLDVDRGNIAGLSHGQVLDYCRRDVEIVRKAWLLEDEWFSRYHVQASTAGTGAVKLLEAMDPVTWSQLQGHLCDRSEEHTSELQSH